MRGVLKAKSNGKKMTPFLGGEDRVIFPDKFHSDWLMKELKRIKALELGPGLGILLELFAIMEHLRRQGWTYRKIKRTFVKENRRLSEADAWKWLGV